MKEELIERLEAGQFRQARDDQAWIKKRTRKTLTESGVRQLLRRIGGKLKVPHKSHAKKDPAKAAISNRRYPTLRKLEDHIVAAVRPWSTPSAVSSLIHEWLSDQVNSGAPT